MESTDVQPQVSKWEWFGDRGKQALDTSLRYGSLAVDETKNIAKFFKMDGAGYLITLGIALTGVAALVNTYDALSNVGELERQCEKTDPLKSELDTKFWITLAISVVGLLFGLVLAWFLRDKQSTGITVAVLSLILLSAFGTLYSIQMKARVLNVGPKLWISWIVFIGFVIGGIAFSWKRPKIAVYPS